MRKRNALTVIALRDTFACMVIVYRLVVAATVLFAQYLLPVLQFLMNQTPSNEALSISSANSNAISFQLPETQNVSAKVYDITGRLIKTLADSRIPQGEHQIEWNKTDEAGNTVSPGIYILQLDAGAYYSDTKKLSIKN